MGGGGNAQPLSRGNGGGSRGIVVSGTTGVCLLLTTLLLGLELVIEQEERLLVCLGGALDGKHALTRLVVGHLGDRDPGPAQAADLGDLGTALADDAADHVGRDRDVLRAQVGCVDEGWSRGVGLASVGRVGSGAGNEASAGSHDGVGVGAARAVVVRVVVVAVRVVVVVEAAVVRVEVHGAHGTGEVSRATLATRTLLLETAHAAGSQDARAVTLTGLVENNVLRSVPVLGETRDNLADSDTDSIDGALDLDDTLSGLGEHLLGGDHACTREILDVLNLETLTTDDGAHEVVRDEEAHRGSLSSGLSGGTVCLDGSVEGVFEDGLCDEGESVRDTDQGTRDGEDAVVNTGDDLGNASLDACLLTELCDVGTALADDDAGFLGGDEGADEEGSVGVDVGTLDIFVASDGGRLGSSSGVSSGVSSGSDGLGLDLCLGMKAERARSVYVQAELGTQVIRACAMAFVYIPATEAADILKEKRSDAGEGRDGRRVESDAEGLGGTQRNEVRVVECG